MVLHGNREVIEEVPRGVVQAWLAGMGLEGMKPSKTRLAHTLTDEGGGAGFHFLGFHVRQSPEGGEQTPYSACLEPDDGKLSRPVLKPSPGSDARA